MNTRGFFRAMFLLIVFGVVFSNFYAAPELAKLQPEYRWGTGDLVVNQQSASTRVWREISADKVFTVGGDHSVQLYGPLHVKVDDRDHLFVVDYGDLLIKEFSPSGDMLRTYGTGRGQGPGEFGSVNDFDFAPSGELWVADDSNGRITIFASDGSFQRTIKTVVSPYRIAVQRTGDFTIMRPLGSAHLFGLFDESGHRLGTFGEFLKDQEQNPLVLDGWIESSGDGFIYAGQYASLIASYAPGGGLKFLVETIDPTPLPKLIQAANDDEVMWVDRKALSNTFSLSVSEGEIHLLSSIPGGLKRKGTIDSYDLEDGSYLYSRKLPEPCLRVVVSGQYVYTVNLTAVTKWSFAL